MVQASGCATTAGADFLLPAALSSRIEQPVLPMGRSSGRKEWSQGRRAVGTAGVEAARSP